VIHLSRQDCELLNKVRRDFPLDSHPFATIADQLGLDEQAVINRLQELEHAGAISRFGAVFKPNVAGASTLVALAVPTADIERTAQLINTMEGVNHNYLREHQFNLWFVITGCNRAQLDERLEQIKQAAPYPMLDLPMEQPYHIDLGFAL
jgi:DNA-binding Lrp family transcriptional regulator